MQTVDCSQPEMGKITRMDSLQGINKDKLRDCFKRVL